MYRWCEVSFLDFWEYTPSEASDMIDEAQEKYKYEHAWLTATLYNAQGGKEDKTAWQPEDFMDSKENEKPVSNEEYTKTWADNFKKRLSLMG